MRWAAEQEEGDIVEIQGGTVHNVVPEHCRVRTQVTDRSSGRQTFLKKFLSVMDAARARLETQENAAFDPPQTTDNIGVVRMRGVDTIEIEFDFRLIPETDGDALFTLFKAIENEVHGAKIEIIRSNAPMNTSPDSEIARRVAKAQIEVGLVPEFLVKSGNTEGAIFCAMGVEAIVTGPGRAVGNIHAPNEHNEIPQLRKAVEFYAAFLGQFC
jgi:acetylornithine deacetylase/succinyl-diaminopimelate desuccinylase-like protein